MKSYARKHPHSMGAWTAESKTNVATMGEDDFRHNEKSVVIGADDTLRVELVGADGSTTVLKESIPVLAGEVVDATFMNVAKLRDFLSEQVERAKEEGVLFSVHLKATMMKVSDPIIFGHVVRAFFPDVFETYAGALASVGASPNDGLGAVLKAVEGLPADERAEVEAAVAKGFEDGPAIAMVDSDKGITNLHVPSDVIVDASMPAMIRTSGHMWNRDGAEQDTLAVLPDSSYAGIYQVVLDDCRAHGAYDPATMGSVPNVGLMAQAAEEYGSHDKTFEIPADGTVRVVDGSGAALLEHAVSARRHLARLPDQGRADPRLGQARRDARPRHRHAGDLLARRRPGPRRQPHRQGERVPHGARHRRPHDRDHEADRRDRLLPRAHPQGRGHDLGHRQRAARLPHRPLPDPRARQSAKMLSVVPLINGGGLFETGAGGSAPSTCSSSSRRTTCAGTAWASSWRSPSASSTSPASPATPARGPRRDARPRDGHAARREQGPARKVGQIDNRGSHVWLALYWAQELAAADRRRRAGRDVRPGRRGARREHRHDLRSSSTSRATRSTSAATTAPTPTRSPR